MKTKKENNARRIQNKTDIPDNVIEKRHKLTLDAQELEEKLPVFLEEFCMYLKNAVAPSTRLAYLHEIKYFLNYLISEHKSFRRFKCMYDIELEAFKVLKARDINNYLANYCAMYEKDGTIYSNGNKSLAKKKSVLSVLFKYLFIHEYIPVNLAEGFNPIKLPKLQPDAIKKLEVDEIPKLLELIDHGEGLTEKEKEYWEKTRLRDKAIIIIFLTYGLRISELQQLDVASFNYERNEFTVYRKRGKESKMPLNKSVIAALKNYYENERPNSLDSDEPMFLSLQKTRLTVRAIRDIVKKYTARIIGGSGYSPHKLRATAASTMIEFGFSIYDVQNVLDHDNVTTTQLYSAHKKHSKSEIIKNFELSKKE